jgi:peptidoglycan DL-endopeptidase CwlO
VASTRTRTAVRSVQPGVAVALAVAALMVFVLTAGPAAAVPAKPPTSASVQAQLTQLQRQKEALAERYNLAQIDVQGKQQAAAAARRAADHAQSAFVAARGQFRQVVTARYEAASFSAAGALLTSTNGDDYVSKMSELSLLTSHRGDLVAQISAAQAKAQAAQATAADLLSKANATLASVVTQRNEVLAKTKKFTDLLATVTAQERAAYAAAHAAPVAKVRAAVAAATAPAQATAGSPRASAGPAPTSTVVPGTMTAQQRTIVDFVVSKVGGCYTFAGVGNPCYDCSGLAMMAYQQVGISLPHNALTQYGYGRHVAPSELQPGDLVFLYQPIGHVEIYIGNGVAVSAADEQLGIRYVNVFDDMADYTGATRLL